jgi:RNA polymerase sigma-70 factor (family 1)
LQPVIYDIDETLVAGLRDGDEAAFTAVYKQLHQRLYFFAQRFIDETQSKDVVSETFVQLWNKRSRLENAASVTSFLFVTAKNKCLNLIRQELTRQDKQSEILQLLESSQETDLFNEQLTTELVQLIYSEIEKLPAKMREVFLLSFAEGLKPAAIAERLNLSVQTVKNQKVSAIKLLQQALGHRAVYLSLLILMHEKQTSGLNMFTIIPHQNIAKV